MGTTAETCQNCERSIGKLEPAFVWDDHLVCKSCYEQLSRSTATKRSKPRRRVIIGSVAAGVILIGAYAIMRHLANSTGAVSGSIWVTRNDATSQLMRGLRVYLLRPAVSVGTLGEALQKTKDDLIREKQRSAISDVSKRLELLDQIEKSLKEPVALNEAFRDLVVTAPFDVPYFSDVATSTLIKRVQADVDGKYAITDVPKGNYFVFATFSSKVLVVDWLVAITVQDNLTKLDLNNRNAALIVNVPEDISAELARLGNGYASEFARANRDYRDGMRIAIAEHEQACMEAAEK